MSEPILQSAPAGCIRQVTLKVAEILLLFAALFFCMPYIPSYGMQDIPLLPGAAYAAILFFGSRLLRWGGRWWVALIEIFPFAVFLFVLNAAINILYRP